MSTYRCIKKGKELLVFDRAGNPVFKKQGQPRQVRNYETGELLALPDDSKLSCVDVNAKPSICAQFAAAECNAFSDICQGYTYNGTRRCRRRGMSFKSLNALERCYYEKEDLLTEIAEIRARLDQSSGPLELSMDRPVSTDSWNQIETEQLRRALAEKEAELAALNQEKLAILQQATTAGSELARQVQTMPDEQAQMLIRSMQREIAELQAQLKAKDEAILAKENELVARSQYMQGLQGQLSAAQQEVSAINTEAQRLKLEYNAQLQQEQAQLQKEIAYLQNMAPVKPDIAFQAQLETLNAELQLSKEQHATAQAELQTQHEALIARKTQEMNQMQDALTQLQEQQVTCQTQLREAEREKTTQNEANDQLTQQCEFDRRTKDSRIAELQQIVNTGTAQMNQLEEQFEQEQRKNEELAQTYETVRAQVAGLQEAQTQLQADNLSLIDQRARESAAYAAEKEKLIQRSAELQDLNQALKQFQGEAEPQLKEFDAIKKEHARLLARYQQLETKEAQEHAEYEALMAQWNAEKIKLEELQGQKQAQLANIQSELVASQELVTQYRTATEQLLAYLKTDDFLTADQKTRFAKDFGVTVAAESPSTSTVRASGKPRMYAKQVQVLQLLKKAIDLIKSAHPPRRRKRGSVRR